MDQIKLGVVVLVILVCACESLSDLKLDLSGDQIRSVRAVGRCRANCLDKFLSNAVRLTKDSCSTKSDCFMCWENCEMMYRNWQVWGLMCGNPVVCFDGCQTVCDFYQHSPPSASNSVTWHFITPISIHHATHHKMLRVRWSAVRSEKSTIQELQTVFSLYWFSRTNKTWSYLTDTIAHGISTNDPRIVNDVDDFRVVAVNRYEIACFMDASETMVTNTSSTVGTSSPMTAYHRNYTYASPAAGDEDDVTGDGDDVALTFIIVAASTAFAVGSIITGGFAIGYSIYNRYRRRRRMMGRRYAFRIKQSGLKDTVRNSIRRKQPMSATTSRTNLMRIDESESHLPRIMEATPDVMRLLQSISAEVCQTESRSAPSGDHRFPNGPIKPIDLKPALIDAASSEPIKSSAEMPTTPSDFESFHDCSSNGVRNSYIGSMAHSDANSINCPALPSNDKY